MSEPAKKCDFCSSPTVKFVLPARDFYMGLGHGSKSDWLACETCAKLIRMNDWKGLGQRAINAAMNQKRMGPNDFSPKEREALETVINKMYRELRKNITGLLKPID